MLPSQYLYLALFLPYVFPRPTFAQCPVCVVTVGGGMLLAKKLGIDDFLVSVWISALNTVISFWLAPKIKIKYLNHPLILSLLMYFLTLAYFHFSSQLGLPGNRLFGVDKIILGQTLGLLSITLGNLSYLYLKKRNGGKTVFPYAKVVFPFGLTLFITLVFKFVFGL